MLRRQPGNLLYNSSFNYAPPFVAAQTGTGWINGTASGSGTNDIYGWGCLGQIGSIACQFDNSVFFGEASSLKLSTLSTNGEVECGLSNNGNGLSPFLIPATPNTSYTVVFYMKTNLNSGAASSGAYLVVVARLASGAYNGSPATTQKVTTTTNWSQYTVTFTTSSTTAFLSLDPIIKGNDGAATLIMDAWYDDVSIFPTSGLSRVVAPMTRSVAGLRSAAV
jgi:hypothetical protein